MATGEILERLQGDLPREGERFTGTVWLTDYREDVLALLEEKGLHIASDLLGVGRVAMAAWMSQHAPANLKSSVPGSGAPHVPSEFWRGKATAYREILEIIVDKDSTSPEAEEAPTPNL